MKHKPARSFAALALAMVLLAPAVLAANPPEQRTAAASACYPTAVTRSEDGKEIRKMYDLSPSEDPAGIPRSDFEQEGFLYKLTDLLKQELPENESRQHTETVTIPSDSKDMATVLGLLPQQREFVTADGLKGTLALKLDTVNVEVAGYGTTTWGLSAKRTYPNLSSQDTSPIPKTITENGSTLTLQGVEWQQSGVTGEGGESYTAVASYTGTASGSYVKGYTVTADYAGTVSRINLNKTRYVAIFEGDPLPGTIVPEAAEPVEAPAEDVENVDEPAEKELPPAVLSAAEVFAGLAPEEDAAEPEAELEADQGKHPNMLLVVGVVVLAGVGIAVFLVVKRRKGW